jgi:hypothetical protein
MNKKIRDLTGQTFHFLTVLSLNEEATKSNKQRGACFNCICVCGKTKIVRGNSLIRGDTKSCGCYYNERKLDLTGKVFHYLTVVGLNKEVTKPGSYFNCICVCGETKVVHGRSLVTGNTKSCGCYHLELAVYKGGKNKKDITGKRFTKLVVIKETGRSPAGHVLWECKCDCGKTVEVEGYRLNRKNVQSCGCLLLVGPPRLQTEERGINTVYCRYKGRGIKVFGSFELDKEHFSSMIKEECFYCGAYPGERAIFHRKKTHEPLQFAYNGIDRVDSSLGYTKENTVPCCQVCNTMKMALSQEKFYSQIKRIYEHKKLNENTNTNNPS